MNPTKNAFNVILFSLVCPAPFLFSGCFSRSTGQAGSLPNIVIILADDMGYGDVSSCNPAARTHTPNIDQLAGQGISFTDAHAAAALCIPSRYGLLTGRYFFRLPPQRIPWGYGAPLIEKGRETIGSLLQKAGYTTACIGKWHLGLEWALKDPSAPQVPDGVAEGPTNTDFSSPVRHGPNELGFDKSFILPASLDMPPYAFVDNDRVRDPVIVMVNEIYPKTKPGVKRVWDQKYVDEDDIYWGRGVWWRNGEMSSSFRVEDCLGILVDEGISFIREQAAKNPEKPFFLYLPLTGPHTPWVPGEEFKGNSEPGTYGDFISQIDHVVYRVTETLRSLDIEENTLLIFKSDNGAHWSENDILTYAHQSNRGTRGQKADIWNGGHRVPLIVRWPASVKGPAICDHTISLVDLFATLAELTGQQFDESCAEDSYSFCHLLRGEMEQPVRDQIIYLSGAGGLAIKSGKWKYIRWLGSGGFTEPVRLEPVEGRPEGQLYDLEEDPLETNNLYLHEPDHVRRLSRMLDSLVNL
jgi:arylsulfatase A-like enzyme